MKKRSPAHYSGFGTGKNAKFVALAAKKRKKRKKKAEKEDKAKSKSIIDFVKSVFLLLLGIFTK